MLADVADEHELITRRRQEGIFFGALSFAGKSAAGLGIRTALTPVRAPRTNAVAERLVETLRRECLDHLIVVNDAQLRAVLGEFVAYEIMPDGRVNARYTNGAVRALYKIPVATFQNQAGLIEESGTMYRVSDKSGQPTLNEVGEQSIQIIAGAVEMANFDLADGFTQLIVTQRAYDTAAQVVRTVDEMHQVAVQLRG